ncbi:hypothetical protein D9611_001515 [Ephemerocybe angulata]|uniref:Rhodopsin domain-containing protein n=1 Tax=Ephemerocybe angulata TaxID=980116 RepID=A0A8H5CII6_9AGAR|nr:hypothetical protein D9611_001515 [Tulosesus angulatus]
MALPPQNAVAWKVCIELLHILALFSTLYRLHYRWKAQHLWWDDYMVTVPLVVDFLYSVLVLVRFQDPVRPHPNPAIGSYWLSTFLFLVVLWSTRIVLSLSLARVFPSGHFGRYVGLGLAIAFALTFLSAVLVTALTCTTMGFVTPKDARCIRGIAGYNVKALYLPFTDYISDVLLIVSAVGLLWKTRLRPRERFLILIIFSASFLTLLSAVVFTIASFANVKLGPHTRFLFGMFASLEVSPPLIYVGNGFQVTKIEQVAISLLVCNLAVVIAGVYRALRNHVPSAFDATGDEATGSRQREGEPSLPSQMTFTEISTEYYQSSGSGISSKNGTPIASDHDYSTRTAPAQSHSLLDSR